MKRNKLLTLFAAFAMVATVSAQVTYTCTAGTNFDGNEGVAKLFDGNENTKFCGNTGADVYALFTASEPVYAWGYDMTTANSSNGHSMEPTMQKLLLIPMQMVGLFSPTWVRTI